MPSWSITRSPKHDATRRRSQRRGSMAIALKSFTICAHSLLPQQGSLEALASEYRGRLSFRTGSLRGGKLTGHEVAHVQELSGDTLAGFPNRFVNRWALWGRRNWGSLLWRRKALSNHLVG